MVMSAGSTASTSAETTETAEAAHSAHPLEHPQNASWKILVERGNLGFAAAHFITFQGECEPLHGHNYGVRVEAVGELTPDSYVFDFVTLKNIVRELCKAWDHRFLLPLHNPHLQLTEHPHDWEIVYTGVRPADAPDAPIRYLMPKWTVVPLPVDNATAERLAQQMALLIVEVMRQRGLGHNLRQLTIGVEETEMQTAFCTLDLPTGPAEAHPPG
ncbi:MAG: 6-carboxytetrahydropterin synthase [Ktedonobacterales bacterium]